MDPISDAASIIAVLQFTVQAVEYLKDVKGAPKECQQCKTEASNLNDLLTQLLYHLSQRKASENWYTSVRALTIEGGPIDQYKKALELLLSRVEMPDGIQRLKKRLLWKFTKGEAASILARMERLKSRDGRAAV